MNARRTRLAALCASTTLTLGAALAPVLMAGPAEAAELLRDGGFERSVAGAEDEPPGSRAWAAADSEWGSPLCDVDYCTGPGGSPRTGGYWAWFGSTDVAGHTASLTQAVLIPRGDTVLTYWYANPQVSAPYDARLTVTVDGTPVKTHVEAIAADPTYRQQTVDLEAFSDGRLHVLAFEYLNGAAGDNAMNIDDVVLESQRDCEALSGAVARAKTALEAASIQVSKAATALKRAVADGRADRIARLRKKLKKVKARERGAAAEVTEAQAAATACR